MLRNDSLHHAYLIEGEREAALAELLSVLERELGYTTKANPDFWHGTFDSLGIDDTRMLKELHVRKKVGRERKIFIVTAVTITHEAQNSLLKMFEEPAADSHFFLIMPTSRTLLPTLLSRLATLDLNLEKDESTSDAEAFLKLTPGERLKKVAPMAEAKDKEATVQFLSGIERALSTRVRGVSEQKSLQEFLKLKGYLFDRSSSVKMILEHLALTLPRR